MNDIITLLDFDLQPLKQVGTHFTNPSISVILDCKTDLKTAANNSYLISCFGSFGEVASTYTGEASTYNGENHKGIFCYILKSTFDSEEMKFNCEDPKTSCMLIKNEYVEAVYAFPPDGMLANIAYKDLLVIRNFRAT